MKNSFFYISDGRLFRYCEGSQAEQSSSVELRSGVLDSYLSRVRESAKRSEWKHTGDGARFRDAYDPAADPESRVSSVYSRVLCAADYEGDTVYSIVIDNTGGIFRSSEKASSEGIVISSSEYTYGDFDIKNGRMVLTAAFAGESHIGVIEMGSTASSMYTEGASWDSQPVWSASSPNRIYFCSSGLPLESPEEKEVRSLSPAQMAAMMITSGSSRARRGPSAICMIDISTGSMDELLADDRYSFTQPQSMPDGSLYYIRKPYSTESEASSSIGCLADLVMLPIRLFGALFGFLNLFSAKYSGKTLSKNYGTKSRDAEKLIIDGNLINAEAELKAARRRGDSNPGIIPGSWELRRLNPDGSDELIRKGILAYRAGDDGEIILSNGSALLKLTPSGEKWSEAKLSDAKKVTFIR